VPPYPEEPDFYSEPTAAARYGGYYEPEPQPPEPPTPWYRRPAALVAAGAIGVILLGALVFAVVKLTSGSPAPSPATTTPVPSTTAPVTTTERAPRHHGDGGGAPTETVTETAPPPSNDTPTTTEPSTTAAPSTETSTVTQTVTEPPRRGPFQPFQPRP
jgi:cytoskeletal protein RodZ